MNTEHRNINFRIDSYMLTNKKTNTLPFISWKSYGVQCKETKLKKVFLDVCEQEYVTHYVHIWKNMVTEIFQWDTIDEIEMAQYTIFIGRLQRYNYILNYLNTYIFSYRNIYLRFYSTKLRKTFVVWQHHYTEKDHRWF